MVASSSVLQDALHLVHTQAGIGLQHECNSPRHERSRHRRAHVYTIGIAHPARLSYGGEPIVVDSHCGVIPAVGRHHALAWSYNLGARHVSHVGPKGRETRNVAHGAACHSRVVARKHRSKTAAGIGTYRDGAVACGQVADGHRAIAHSEAGQAEVAHARVGVAPAIEPATWSRHILQPHDVVPLQVIGIILHYRVKLAIALNGRSHPERACEVLGKLQVGGIGDLDNTIAWQCRIERRGVKQGAGCNIGHNHSQAMGHRVGAPHAHIAIHVATAILVAQQHTQRVESSIELLVQACGHIAIVARRHHAYLARARQRAHDPAQHRGAVVSPVDTRNAHVDHSRLAHTLGIVENI